MTKERKTRSDKGIRRKEKTIHIRVPESILGKVKAFIKQLLK